MQKAVTFLALLGLMLIPLACVISVCQVTAQAHDCCPKHKTFSACPLDLLDSAKAAKSVLPAIAITATAVVSLAVQPAPETAIWPVPVSTGLHSLHSILRI